jgi:hypothetical protein
MITPQKLYEKIILMTAEGAEWDDENPLFNIVKSLPEKYTFEQLCIQSEIYGVPIPGKENFVEWGERYLIQCMSTIIYFNDSDMLNMFLDSVFSIPKLKKLVGEEFANICYDLYIEHVMHDHDIAKMISEVIIKHLTTYDRFKDFYRIAHATGIFGRIDYSTFLKLDPFKVSEKSRL